MTRRHPSRHPDDDNGGGDPLPLEPHEDDHRPPPPSSGDAKCPNCGETREDPHALVCLHCGYDMKTLRVIETATGEVEAVDEEEEGEGRTGPPLSEGMGPEWLPFVLLVPSAGIMVVAFLAGARGLFPGLDLPETEPIAFGTRMNGLGRFVVQAGLLTGCGLVALMVLAWMLGRRLGDPKQAALRVLTLMLAIRVASIIDLKWRAGEWMLETAIMSAAFVGLAFLLFGLRPREVITWGLLMVATFASFWAMSWLGMWSMG